MILWMERFQNESKLGILTFDPVTRQKRERNAFDYDNVEKTAIAGLSKAPEGMNWIARTTNTVSHVFEG